jgi:hypothetical protein
MKTHHIRNLFFAVALAALTMCTKDKDENSPAPTCSDGIQNQNETGVDCGGPCAACPTVLCNGSASVSYWPLGLSNTWGYYFEPTGSFPYQTETITQVQSGTPAYYLVKNDGFFLFDLYLSVASNGDIYYHTDLNSTDFLMVPAFPTPNQTWPIGTSGDYEKVISINATLSTSHCSYTGCLQISRYDGSNSLQHTIWFKRGIGMLKYQSGMFSMTLDQITLH